MHPHPQPLNAILIMLTARQVQQLAATNTQILEDAEQHRQHDAMRADALEKARMFSQ